MAGCLLSCALHAMSALLLTKYYYSSTSTCLHGRQGSAAVGPGVPGGRLSQFMPAKDNFALPLLNS